ncbi:MAG: PDZ domain-containing protein [candidate division Zixibacteria bacterium]|nr:PDZ domain-containing protein [candidate division Zixibacteria bacterium]
MIKYKKLLILSLLMIIPCSSILAYDFDYKAISKDASEYLVIIDIEVEVSFGTQSTDMKNRTLGTIVSSEGLIIFDGNPINADDPFSVMSGMEVNIEPQKIEITLMDERVYQAEFIGIDQFTKLGFCKIISGEKETFKYLKLKKRNDFKIGEMLTVYMLLPNYVTPSLAVDVGMVSALVEEPEEFVLTVGFNELEAASVIFDNSGDAVGILTRLTNQGQSEFGSSSGGFTSIEDFMPLLGIGDLDKIMKLFKNPPKKGEATRGWLGIHLQALTTDIAEFWKLNIAGGIIVNEVVESSPADKAGLETGDIIVKLNGHPIEVDSEETLPIFRRKILEFAAETEVSFEIFRRQNGAVDTLNITATLTRAPLSPSEASDFEDNNFEIKIRNMVFADYSFYNLDQEKFKGVVVKEIENGGWASVGGLHPGDIIQSIDGNKVTNIEETQKLLSDIVETKPEEVIFFIWRNNKTLFVNIKTDW